MLHPCIFITIKDEASTRPYNLLFDAILFFHPKSSSEKLLFSVSSDSIESNAERMKPFLLQSLQHAERKEMSAGSRSCRAASQQK